MFKEAVEKFLASKTPSMAEKFGEILLVSVNFLNTLETPSEKRYKELEAYLATIPSKGGRYNGKLPSPKTLRERMSFVREFYNSQRGDATIPMFEDEKKKYEVPANSENEHKTENQANLESEHEADDSEATSTEPKKRGRKKKAEDEKPVQVSIYLEREIYEAVKDLGAVTGQNISDIVSELAKNFVNKNLDVLKKMRAIKELQVNFE